MGDFGDGGDAELELELEVVMGGGRACSACSACSMLSRKPEDDGVGGSFSMLSRKPEVRGDVMSDACSCSSSDKFAFARSSGSAGASTGEDARTSCEFVVGVVDSSCSNGSNVDVDEPNSCAGRSEDRR